MVSLDSLSQTALVPFWARVQDAQSHQPILGDWGAVSIAPVVREVYGELRVDVSTQVGCCLRDKLLDSWVRGLMKLPGLLVVDLGVGLDTRLLRIPELGDRYLEVDQPPIMQARELLIPGRPLRISGDALAIAKWLPKTAHAQNIAIILSGVLPYQTGQAVARFLDELALVTPGVYLLFDSVSPISLRLSNRTADKLGRPIYLWSTWSTRRIRSASTRLEIIEEKGLLDCGADFKALFGRISRSLYSLPVMRRSYRISLARIPLAS